MRFRIVRRRPAKRRGVRLPAPQKGTERPSAPSAAALDNPYSPVFGAPRSRDTLRRGREG